MDRIPGGLDNSKVASGLKQALEIGTANTVTRTGKANGYFGDTAIKIGMPDKLRTLERFANGRSRATDRRVRAFHESSGGESRSRSRRYL